METYLIIVNILIIAACGVVIYYNHKTFKLFKKLKKGEITHDI